MTELTDNELKNILEESMYSIFAQRMFEALKYTIRGKNKEYRELVNKIMDIYDST